MKLTLFAFCLLIGASSFAQSSTEFFHRAADGASELTPHAGYRSATTLSKTTNSSDVNMSGVDRLGVQYEYGLNSSLALGVDFAYSSYTFSGGGSSGDSNGLEPLRFMLKSQIETDNGWLQYGVGASIGLEKAKLTNTTQNRSFGDYFGSTPASGFKLAPYVGYEYTISPTATIGAKFSYELVSGKAKVDAGLQQDLTFSGGNVGQASLFYEGKTGEVAIGGALTYDFIEKSEVDLSSGVIGVVKAHSFYGARAYARIPVASGIDVLPSLVWQEKANTDVYDKARTSSSRSRVA